MKLPDGKKITKDAANYRMKSINRHCEDCSMFRRPDACTLVMGPIASRGTCRFWERRSPSGSRKN